MDYPWEQDTVHILDQRVAVEQEILTMFSPTGLSSLYWIVEINYAGKGFVTELQSSIASLLWLIS